MNGLEPRRDEQLVEVRYVAGIVENHFAVGVYVGDTDAELGLDAVLLVPVDVVQDDVGIALLSGQH
jgi:hypothetical protein